MKDLLSSHPEFGRQKAQDILAGGDPKQEQMKSVDDWFDQVSSLFDPLLVKQLHGRLFILGLCRLDEDLAKHLDNSGFRPAIEDELFEDFVSLLTPGNAGAGSYKGDFLRILQNRAKSDASLGVARSNGFFVNVIQGVGLEPLARLCLRQNWNDCRTARYVLPPGSGFSNLLTSLFTDLGSLVANTSARMGSLLPNPESDGKWKSYATQLTDSRSIADLASGGVDNLFSALGSDELLGTGKRLVLFAEFRGVADGASLDEIGLNDEVIKNLTNLPERIGVVVSGLPQGLLERIEGPNVTHLSLPPDLQRTRAKPLKNDMAVGPDQLLRLSLDCRLGFGRCRQPFFPR